MRSHSIGSAAVAAPRDAWTCDLITGVAASIPGSFGLKPKVIERQPAWSVLGADPLAVPALPPRPPTVPTAPLRGVHTFIKKVTVDQEAHEPIVRLLGPGTPIAKGFTRAAIRTMAPYHDGSVLRSVVNWERRRSSRCSILNRRTRFLGASLRDDFIRIPG